MAAIVTYLRPHERVWLDPTRIGVLYAELGGPKVQEVMDRAMQELAFSHRELIRCYQARDIAGFTRRLRALERVSEHLGLTTIARISCDVADCLCRGDATATAATWARLSRSIDQVVLGNWIRL